MPFHKAANCMHLLNKPNTPLREQTPGLLVKQVLLKSNQYCHIMNDALSGFFFASLRLAAQKWDIARGVKQKAHSIAK